MNIENFCAFGSVSFKYLYDEFALNRVYDIFKYDNDALSVIRLSNAYNKMIVGYL